MFPWEDYLGVWIKPLRDLISNIDLLCYCIAKAWNGKVLSSFMEAPYLSLQRVYKSFPFSFFCFFRLKCSAVLSCFTVFSCIRYSWTCGCPWALFKYLERNLFQKLTYYHCFPQCMLSCFSSTKSFKYSNLKYHGLLKCFRNYHWTVV